MGVGGGRQVGEKCVTNFVQSVVHGNSVQRLMKGGFRPWWVCKAYGGRLVTCGVNSYNSIMKKNLVIIDLNCSVSLMRGCQVVRLFDVVNIHS